MKSLNMDHAGFSLETLSKNVNNFITRQYFYKFDTAMSFFSA